MFGYQNRPVIKTGFWLFQLMDVRLVKYKCEFKQTGAQTPYMTVFVAANCYISKLTFLTMLL